MHYESDHGAFESDYGILQGRLQSITVDYSGSQVIIRWIAVHCGSDYGAFCIEGGTERERDRNRQRHSKRETYRATKKVKETKREISRDPFVITT